MDKATEQHDTGKALYDRFRRVSAADAAASNGHHSEEDDRSIGELVKDLTTHAQQLVRGEIDLVRSEVTDKAKSLAVYVGMGIAAAVFGLISLIFLGHLIAQALNEALPAWASYLVVTVIYVAIAGGLALAAKKGFQKTNMAPTDSVESAKEDIQWVKTHK